MRLQNKVVLITASTRGIGLACVKACAKEGAAVYMAARDMERAQEIANTLNGVKCVYNDATKPETFTSMVEDVVFDEAEVKAEIDIAVEGFARQLEQRGMNLEAYLQACGRTREEMDAELRPQAEDTIKARMALNEICRLEGITVTQEEVDQAYADVAAMYRVSVQEVKEAYGQDNDEKLRKDVLLKKAIAVLEANAEITEE